MTATCNEGSSADSPGDKVAAGPPLAVCSWDTLASVSRSRGRTGTRTARCHGRLRSAAIGIVGAFAHLRGILTLCLRFEGRDLNVLEVARSVDEAGRNSEVVVDSQALLGRRPVQRSSWLVIRSCEHETRQ